MHEVIAPHVITVFGLKTDTRSVIQPEPAFLGLFHWYFQPLSSPQPFDALVIHMPAGISQQRSYPTIAVAAILSGQLDHVRDKAILISSPHGHLTLCGSVLSQNATRSAF
jgi:hypothetical protein